MNTLDVIIKTREYLDYVEEHYNYVQKAFEEIKIKCKGMRFIWDDYYYFNLETHVELHDISKLSSEEFIQYRDHFFPVLDGDKKDFSSEAWENHKKHNPHHWETWTTIESHNPNEWEIHCAHMVIDWMAMGYKFGDTAQKYYEKNREKIILPDYAIEFIYEIFDAIGGE